MRDGIFKLIAVHALVIYHFPEFTGFPFHLGKTPLSSIFLVQVNEQFKAQTSLSVNDSQSVNSKNFLHMFVHIQRRPSDQNEEIVDSKIHSKSCLETTQ